MKSGPQWICARLDYSAMKHNASTMQAQSVFQMDSNCSRQEPEQWCDLASNHCPGLSVRVLLALVVDKGPSIVIIKMSPNDVMARGKPTCLISFLDYSSASCFLSCVKNFATISI